MPIPLRATPAAQMHASLLLAVSRISAILSAEMADEAGISMERYEILLLLSQGPDEGMRPSDLADTLPITRSGTTRLIDRLVRDGLVQRAKCRADRRGTLVRLSPAGEEAFRRAGRIHLRGLEEHVAGHLSNVEMAEVQRVLSKLTEQLDPGSTALP